MPLGVLEIVNSNSGTFDLDVQYLAYLLAEFAGYVINNLNNEIRKRKAEHSRSLLNQYAVKIFRVK
jgi:ABC-type sulfate transport system substrate-binding protein